MRHIKQFTAAINLVAAELCAAVCFDAIHRDMVGQAFFSAFMCVLLAGVGVIFFEQWRRH